MDIPHVINEDQAATGEMGQQYLACGKAVALRLWNEPAGEQCESCCRDYEIVGYLTKGKLDVTLNGETAHLGEGDSWLIPAGADHQYKIIEDIVAIEATSPPARLGGKDELTSS